MGLIIKNGIQYPGVGSGEGSGLEISQLDDVKITPPLENGDKLVYDKEKGKWTNTTKYHNYSTEEQVVGKWIDGKPIYEKVIYVEKFIISDTNEITLENLDTIINYSGNLILTDFPRYKRFFPYSKNNSTDKVVITRYTDTKIYVDSAFNCNTIYIRIQYTKTTD